MFSSDFGLFYQSPRTAVCCTAQLQQLIHMFTELLWRTMILDVPCQQVFLQSILGFLLVLSANAVVRKIEKDSALF